MILHYRINLNTFLGPSADVDKLELEFANYQTDSLSNFPALFKEARVDKQWNIIPQMREHGALKYPLLSKVMKVS